MREKNKQYIFSAYAHKITHFETSFLNVLRNFYTSHKDMRLVFYGDSLYHIMQLPFVRHVPMSNYRDYMDSIIQSKSLFAVTPLGGSEDLIDIRFNICKSPIKYIMYGFSGTPCIFSDVLPYKKYVINEQTGLLVKNNYEAWRDALERMVKDVDLHRKIQKNAYEDICNNYHIKKTAGVYLKDVLGIISH